MGWFPTTNWFEEVIEHTWLNWDELLLDINSCLWQYFRRGVQFNPLWLNEVWWDMSLLFIALSWNSVKIIQPHTIFFLLLFGCFTYFPIQLHKIEIGFVHELKYFILGIFLQSVLVVVCTEFALFAYLVWKAGNIMRFVILCIFVSEWNVYF